MISEFTPVPGGPATPSILVVDDDRRVLELLEVALTANGCRVLTAADGDEAIKRALGERPDLVVLDMRLPKKSGLEVCEVLRHDADDPFMPIIVVSAASETDARLQAFRRGADDYLSKPFSPKELVARIRRLLTRSAEGVAARQKARALDHELSLARAELRRAHDETRRAERLSDLAFGVGRELHRSADVDDLARRFLGAVQRRLGLGMTALLLPDAEGRTLEPAAIRGDGFERIAALEIAREGELATLVAGLGRPVVRRELERLPELRAALAPFVASGIALVAPLRGARGLDGLLVADERRDGAEIDPADLDLLRGLCDIAAVALENVHRHRGHADGLLDLLAEQAQAGGEAAHGGALALRAEAGRLVERAGRACLLPPRQRALLAPALVIGPWGWSTEGRDAFERIGARDATGRVGELARLLEGARALDFDPEGSPDERRASVLIGVALEYLARRALGGVPPAALSSAMERAGEALDPATAQALTAAMRESQHAESPAL